SETAHPGPLAPFFLLKFVSIVPEQMAQQEHYEELIGKLDGFIRKYHKNRLIKGVIYAFTLLLSGYLLFTSMESMGHFGITTRTVLFYTFIGALGLILYRYVLVPAGHLYRIGKVISHEEAARIIGTHFPEVEDRLLNVLQLREQARNFSGSGLELLEASIRQKAIAMRPVAFISAIRLSENKRYLRWAAIPTLILVVVLIT
ncbi:MAG: hypothetical protein ACKO7B_11515, partial [Flavobacteriales bacterium]